MKPEILCSNLVKIVPDATFFHFGILSSTMYMAWVRQVCGRMKSDYRYSNKLVYNNFPWPLASAEQRERVEEKAQAVLAAREKFMEWGAHAPSRAAADASSAASTYAFARWVLVWLCAPVPTARRGRAHARARVLPGKRKPTRIVSISLNKVARQALNSFESIN